MLETLRQPLPQALPGAPPGNIWMRRMRRLHFVGIGGIGMSGIAELMHDLGFVVSGSDQVNSPVLQRLQSRGITVYHGHRREHAAHCDVLVVSSAIADDNPEVVGARQCGAVVIPRAQMLAEIMRFKYGIAITGSHGKTTTTSLLVSLLEAAGFDPTFAIGGRLTAAGHHAEGGTDGIDDGSNARLGRGSYLVAEADESDATFLHLQPMLAVVTNIDNDHLQAYGGTLEGLQQAFVSFLYNLPFYGLAVLCADDPMLNKLQAMIARPQLRYGINEVADVNASDIIIDGCKTHFRAHIRYRDERFDCTLNMSGQHNVLNTLAAIAVATELGIEHDIIVNTLATFKGIKRRIQRYGDLYTCRGERFTLVDDYAHHPRELQVTLAAISGSYPERRMVVVFQPHRFTRLRDLLAEFALALARAEVLILMSVYAASEPPIEGADSAALAALIEANRVSCGKPLVLDTADQVLQHLPQVIADGDVVVTLGAGNIAHLAPRIQQQFAVRSKPVDHQTV